MTITLTPQGVVGFVIAALVIVLLVYLILLVKKLIGTLKALDTVLEDAKSITEVASRRTNDIDGMVDGIVEAAGIVSNSVKGNQNIARAASGIVNATASCVGFIKSKRDKKRDAEQSAK